MQILNYLRTSPKSPKSRKLFEHLEIPRGPIRIGIKRSDWSPFRLLAIIHIPHLSVVYHQYLTPMIANGRSAMQEVFCCFMLFLHYSITFHPAKLSDNIMFAIAQSAAGRDCFCWLHCLLGSQKEGECEAFMWGM